MHITVNRRGNLGKGVIQSHCIHNPSRDNRLPTQEDGGGAASSRAEAGSGRRLPPTTAAAGNVGAAAAAGAGPAGGERAGLRTRHDEDHLAHATRASWVVYGLHAWASIKPNNQLHFPPTRAQGMIIDAGSTGSRMHVYQWDARRFRDVPPPFSYPLTSNRWTDRLAYVKNEKEKKAVPACLPALPACLIRALP